MKIKKLVLKKLRILHGCPTNHINKPNDINQENYKEYIDKVKPLAKKFGAEYIIRGGENKIIEGNPDKIKFVTDSWKFTKNINNKSPNWYLSEIISQ